MNASNANENANVKNIVVTVFKIGTITGVFFCSIGYTPFINYPFRTAYHKNGLVSSF